MSIKIENLNHIYSEGTPFEKHALKDVCIDIKDGEFIGLIGHTGSGKSTLIQHINRLLKPSTGKILVDDININDEKVHINKIRQKVGLVFQYPEHQLFETTVFNDVAFGPKNMGISGDLLDERVRGALTSVGIDESYYEKSPFELSGGQKRRVAIAGVLAMKPSVLILDEPTAGLDPKGRNEILNEIKKIHKSDNITIILVSHSMEDIARYVNRIIVMDNGEVKLDGSNKEVFSKVELLESIGLAAPNVTYLMKALKDRGLPVSTEAITIEEAYDELLKVLKND